MLTLSSPEQDTIRDTTNISGSGGSNVQVTISELKAPRTWTVAAATFDSNDSCIHYGSTYFTTIPADTIDVSLDLAARYSMLKISFNGIPDSAVTLKVTLDGGDKVFDIPLLPEKRDTVVLSYDYLNASTTGVNHTISLQAFGVYYATDTMLYTVDTLLTILSGEDKVHTITCKWVGPKIPTPIVSAMKDTTVTLRNVLTISVAAITDKGSISGYVWALNGVDYKDTTTIGTINSSFTTGGKHTVYVRAYNSFGLYSAADSIIITVPAIAPKVNFLENIYTIYTNVDSLLDITVNASDADGTVDKYLWSLDNKDFMDTTLTATSSLKATGTGSSMLYVKVMDNDSLFSEVDSCTIVKKIWAPVAANIAYDTLIIDSIAPLGDMKAYSFSGTVGDNITLRMHPSNSCFDAKVELYSPTGVLDTVGFDNVHEYPIQRIQFVEYTLKATGTYTIFVSENWGDTKSDFTMSLQCRQQVLSKSMPIAYDTLVTDSIAPLGDMKAYSFSGTVGDNITLRVHPSNSCFDAKVELYSPTGVLDTVGFDNVHEYPIQRIEFIDYMLKTTGAYTIFVSENWGDTKSTYTMSLQVK